MVACRILKRVILSSLLLAGAASCSKLDNYRTEDEASALVGSVFTPAPSSTQNIGESGFIGSPGGSTSGGVDGGFIGAPGSGTSSGGTSSGTTNSGTVGAEDPNLVEDTTTGGGSLDEDVMAFDPADEVGAGSSEETVVADSGTGSSGSDGGAIGVPAPTDNNEDGGVIGSGNTGSPSGEETGSVVADNSGSQDSNSGSVSTGSSDEENSSNEVTSGSSGSSGDEVASGNVDSHENNDVVQNDTVSNDTSTNGTDVAQNDTVPTGDEGSSSGSSHGEEGLLCHVPPGNPYNAHTIQVGKAAVKAHLAHGDYLGECRSQRKTLRVEFDRVCSQRRSKIKKFKFFEDARNPILAVEAYPNLSTYYATMRKTLQFNKKLMAGIFQTPELSPSTLVSVMDLSTAKLLDKDTFRGTVELDTSVLEDRYSSNFDSMVLMATVCDDVNGTHTCRDKVGYDRLSMETVPFSVNQLPEFVTVGVWSGRNRTLKNNGDLCEKQYSPIVMDLNGNGIKLQAAEKGVRFDLDDMGIPVYTGWTAGADDAFLVRDIDGDGHIDSGAELFGTATKLGTGNRASNGFEALKELDSNFDGVLSPEDTEWKSLSLWFDSNRNGLTEPGELIGLDAKSIRSMNLDYIEMMEVDKHGNETRQRSTFKRKTANKLASFLMVDIWFRTLGGE